MGFSKTATKEKIHSKEKTNSEDNPETIPQNPHTKSVSESLGFLDRIVG